MSTTIEELCETESEIVALVGAAVVVVTDGPR